MLRSMTGYGEASSTYDDVHFKIELISLNSRHLDVSYSLPNGLEYLEPTFRTWVSNHIKRGHVRVKLNIEYKNAHTNIDYDLINKLIRDTLKHLKGLPNIQKSIDITALITYPGFQKRNLVPEIPVNKIFENFNEALQKLLKSKQEEGSRIEQDIRKRINLIKKHLNRIKKLKQKEVELKKEKVEEFFSEYNQTHPELLSQVITSLTIKADITEELVRMESHIKQFRETLKREPPVGKRLEFIAQEMLRESTTMSQKSSLPEVISQTIQIREEIEKIKEQLRNVE